MGVHSAVQAWSQRSLRSAALVTAFTPQCKLGHSIRPIIKRIDPYACKQAMAPCLLIALLIAFVNSITHIKGSGWKKMQIMRIKEKIRE